MSDNKSTVAGTMMPEALANADTILQAIHKIGLGMDGITSNVQSMRHDFENHRREFGDLVEVVNQHTVTIANQGRAIHGSKAPPPINAADPKPEPLNILVPKVAARAATTMGDVSELKGELIAVRAELDKQSKAMGIGPRKIQWMPSKSDMAAAVRYATLCAAIYAAFRQAGLIK